MAHVVREIAACQSALYAYVCSLLGTGAGAPARSVAARLVRGEAMRVTPGGTMDRIASVARRPGAAEWSLSTGDDSGAVIAAVRDNRRDTADTRYYQIVRRGFAQDARAYVDRSYQSNGVDRSGLPEALRGT